MKIQIDVYSIINLDTGFEKKYSIIEEIDENELEINDKIIEKYFSDKFNLSMGKIKCHKIGFNIVNNKIVFIPPTHINFYLNEQESVRIFRKHNIEKMLI